MRLPKLPVKQRLLRPVTAACWRLPVTCTNRLPLARSTVKTINAGGPASVYLTSAPTGLACLAPVRRGTKVLGEDKEVDRSKLAAEVFADPSKLRRLEQILHPRVIARVLEARSMLPNDAVLVVEAIKLLEGELRKVCDRIWVVVSPRETMIERLAARVIGKREAAIRLAQQLTDDQFRAAADAVIVNDGDRDRTRERVREAWAALRGARA